MKANAKKTATLAVMLLTLLACSVSADNDTNDTVGDDVKAFNNTWGAKVRLLQLETHLERNILWGQEIIDAIKQQNDSADTSGLEAILSEMAALKAEVANTTPESGEDGARKFVDLKSDAIELTKEFREAARGMLKPGEADGLRQRLRGINKGELKNLRSRLNETVREYNALRLGEVLAELNLSNPGLVEDLRNGDAEIKDVKEYLKDAVKNMSREDRKNAVMTLKEASSKRRIFQMAVVQKYVYNHVDRLQGRLERRLENAQNLNLSEAAVNRIQRKLNWTGQKIEKVEDKLDKGQNKNGKQGGKGGNKGGEDE